MREPLRMGALSGEDMARLGSIDATMPIYHCGKQWAVTGHGIEELPAPSEYPRALARTPFYKIAKADLKNATAEEWAGHMQEKNWLDLVDFNEALAIAGEVYGLATQADTLVVLNDWIATRVRKKSGLE